MESVTHDLIETSDFSDTSREKDSLQSESDHLTPTEPSPAEKDEERNPVTEVLDSSTSTELLDAKYIEKDPSKDEKEKKTEEYSSDAEKTQQIEKGASQNEEVAKGEEEEETEQTNETKENRIEALEVKYKHAL